MKSAFLLTAMLSGLCAEVVASSIGNIHYEIPAPPFVERDLHFNAGPGDEAFPDEYPQQLVTTDFDQAINHGEDFAMDGNSGYLGVPEPPPFLLMLFGLNSLGFFALGRRARRIRRWIRRRNVVRMRAITAER
jgi:hypothetical protein